MTDFIEYVVSELKSKRLSRESALDLVRQFSARTTSTAEPSVMHPLLHRNVSDIHRQCYRSSFDGGEFFLNDHQVVGANGESLAVLPGVAYLEMARAAVADALPDACGTDRIRLADVVWIKPIVVTRPKDVFVTVSAAGAHEREGSPEIEFEIFSEEPAEDGRLEEVIHCRGSATVAGCDVPERLDIEALRQRVTAGQLEAGVVYPAYRRMGMKFGPAHQAVSRVFRGERECLALLTLPSVVDGTLQAYQLHPSLMDGALQAAVGLMGDLQALPAQPSLPFALESLHVVSGCKRQMVAWIRHADGSRPGDKVTRLDIDLCDEQGNVAVRFRGFSSRPLVDGSHAGVKPQSPGTGLVLAHPVWKRGEIGSPAAAGDCRQLVLLCSLPGVSGADVQALMPDARCQDLSPTSAGLAGRFIEAALNCFEAVRRIVQDNARSPVMIHVVVPDEIEAGLQAGLSGLLKSASLERPDIRGRLLLVDACTTPEQLASRLRAERVQAGDAVVRYREGVRQVLGWQELREGVAEPAIAFNEGGVYLITGGLGGLGSLFAREILRQTAKARIVLTGRAEASQGVTQMLQALAPEDAARHQHRLTYRSLDLVDGGQVRQLVADVEATHGGLSGIIHCAGMVRDNFIVNKTAAEFAQVLAPKVCGAVNLDLASRHLDLDFLVLFSSGASVMGNVGQSDYAAANGFLDQFAHYRNRLAAAGHRKGRTLAINWPLWQEGGMRMPQQDQDAMREATGMHALQTQTGLRAFHRCLEADQPQAVVIEGDVQKIRRVLFEGHDLAAGSVAPLAASAAAAAADAATDAADVADAGVEAAVERPLDDLSEATRDYLRKQLAALFKLPYAKVDPRAPLEKYGIDSILAMDLTRQLEKRFGPLSKTLFFEHQTVDELTAYFLRSHAATLQSMFADAGRSLPRGAHSPLPASEVVALPPAARRAARAGVMGRLRREHPGAALPSHDAAQCDPVAIVGLSGRYPESADVEAFWENLRDGKDCITEIPRDRWDWRDYYREDRTAEGSHYSKWGGFIAGVDEFDPLFFNIPPVDAETLDPQERLFLQHAWMAVEDAGYTRAALQAARDDGRAGEVGVYVGVMYGEYQLFGAESSLQGRRIGIPVSYASIANRVSYVMNLHGPSMTLDTMCSSSLTAIHLACQDLRLGRTSLAIAGGVNVTIHPNKYLILSAGQYISGDGHCQSFGEGGDGYIPGEGVGAVVLKRLSEAQRDGNHIYGVIKGSALNHGGKTNGYSVPNPKAQAGVVASALREYGVDARHVSYIEAHGTGTRLGDPIEIAALSTVFRQFTEARQFCAIGSAKSNIGHCESAAGIAGLTKVLLQMKHRMIVPSLHSAVLNPHIDFESSPFVVNQALRDWDRPVVDGKPVPRIAGISSFGAGGSNAHLIVEEYEECPAPGGHASRDEPPGARGPVVVPLSARTHDQLQRRAADLLAFIGRQQAVGLQSLAYTLQVGREAMDVRVAFVVSSIAELAQMLESYGRDEQHIDQCFQGQVGSDMDGMAVLSQDDDMAGTIDKWIARGKTSKLADLWTKGLEVDWRKCHGECKPPLISLPTYPFARDRYWVARAPQAHAPSGPAAPLLHPLLHVNTSDLVRQSYTSLFSGDEFFLADHQIGVDPAGRQKILPGVAYLEMAREAVDLALPGRRAGEPIEIRNVVWAQPFVADRSRRLAIVLAPQGEAGVGFEVRSGDADAPDRLVHCQGQVAVSEEWQGEGQGDRIDLDALRARMTQGELAVAGIYEAFEAMGIHYGPSFRCIATLHRGRGELLARLTLPAAQARGYVLHPGLLDSALQASIGLVAGLDRLPTEPSIPFALEALKLVAPFAPQMFAWVRNAADSRAAPGTGRIDIDLCDPDGRLCASLRGLTVRTVRGSADEDRIGLLLARPAWETVPVAEAQAEAEAAPPAGHGRRQVVLCGLPQLDLQRLQAALPGSRVERIDLAGADDVAARYRLAALACFERLKGVLKDATQERVLFQLVVADEGDDELLAGLSGLIDTARLENPRLAGQVVLIGRNLDDGGHLDEGALAGRLLACGTRPDHSLVRCEGTAQRILRWEPEEVRGHGGVAFRDGGIYLITGGLGGLGTLFAREIFARAKDAVVVMTGRSALDDGRRVALDALARELALPAGRLLYRPLNLERQEQVQATVAGVVEEFGGLTGILHSAGTTRDGLIVNKTAAQFEAVLEPKVTGTVHLDLATRQLGLDFFVLFSSVASVRGNAGQADYAAANGFMDRFAAYRNRLVEAGRRHGRTLSIHWPLWEQGGMQLDAQAMERLTRISGMVPLETASGMQAFHRILESGTGQVMVMAGHLERLRRTLQDLPAPRHLPVGVAAPLASPQTAPLASPLFEATVPTAAMVAGVGPTSNAPRLQEMTQRYLIERFSSLLKIPSHEVDAKSPLEKYGMDSVLAMKLTNQLEDTFGSLSKTLFFEYQTIAGLAGYLVKAFPEIVREKTGVQADGVARRDPVLRMPAAAGRFAAVVPLAGRAPAQTAGRPGRTGPAHEAEVDVAIIGVGGRYPQARDLREFWRNLRDGRDCITEIPNERWDHAAFFSPGRNQPGRSYSKWGGFLAGVDQFDALFFGISPREAELIDPQERLFIETVWETIEDAGYSKDAIARNRVGVYVGAMWGQYELYGAGSGAAGVPSSSFASIANRVSYFFDFKGPSLALDTMCSSSLTAIHLACEEVRKGTVDVAIAGGVNVSIHPSKYLSLSQGNFASTDGRCRSFGDGGDGYVPGEGVGAVLLKPLGDAVRDGDQVYAVVKASAINHGGKTNGYTVPNPVAQADLILEVLDKAALDPATIGYVETHGTGTSLGDPIEITGLVRAFEGAARQGSAQGRQSCAIGSVKSNIGHLESAAGIAAVTKVLLQFKHRQLVPSLHAERLNPHIDFAATPFYVQRTLDDWKRPLGHPRRAAVSSFGAGGANAHLVLEEYDHTLAPMHRQDRPQAFLLSARTRETLHACVVQSIDFLEAEPDLSLPDIAYTSQVGRTPLQERLVVIADSTSALKDKLQQWLRQWGSGAAAGDIASKRLATAAIAAVYEGSTRDARASAGALFEGDAGRAFLQLALEQRDLDRLAKLWVFGVEVEWSELHREERPKRVSMPTYPFARERYWIGAPAGIAAPPAAAEAVPAALGAPSAADASAAAGDDAPAVGLEPRQMLYYRNEWRAAPFDAAADEGGSATGPLLCLGADDGLLAELERRVGGVGLVAVQYAGGYRQFGPMRYGVDPRSEADFLAVVGDLQSKGAMPRAIVQVVEDTDDVRQTLDEGVFALHGLCKALMKLDFGGTVRIVCVQARRSSAGQPALHRANAGYLKSLALENPKFAWKVVAVDGEPAAADIAHCLSDELGEAGWRDGEVRYLRAVQDGRPVLRREVSEVKRRVPRVPARSGQEQMDQPGQEGQPPQAKASVKQNGVYLVTGGLGGLGFIFSKYLAREYGARLVLTGRSALDAGLAGRLAALNAHRSRGADVVYVQADVSDPEQARAVVREARRRFSRLDGVIHSAGVHRDAFAINKTLEEMASVLAAKVLGAINLDRETADDDLDLFVMFSSVAGAFGNAGQCDYAFANSFLDAFAAQRQALAMARKRSGRSLSIDWPFWEEGGMRMSASDVDLMARRSGISPLPTQSGIDCWETFLQSDETQAIALYGDPSKIDAFLSRSTAAQAAAQAAAHSAAHPTASAPAPEQAMQAVEMQSLQEATEGYLKALLGEEIKLPVERIDSQERFEAFGVDSMMINRINARLEEDLGELPKTLFYQYATIEELAGHLVQEAGPALTRRLSPSAPLEPAGESAASPQAEAAPATSAAVPALASPPDRAPEDEPIAIIGVHGRFPGSESMAEYWRNLAEGRDLVGLVPASRWDFNEFFDADPGNAGQGRIYCKWGGFLDDVDRFDAAFFNVTPDDARMIDPQERLFIQSVWAAVEDAGYTRESLKKRHPKARSADVGVFVGVTTNTYHLLAAEEWRRGNMVSPASLPWSIANRVSYFFDFQGPSMPVDTACSSSLVAIHLACASLQRKECQVAVAGGVNLYLHPSKYQSLCGRRMLATDGKCRSYGDGDDGFIPGEGVGTVVLKPLSRAIADRDHVYGVVAASACEHSGRSNGYSAPNPNSQATLIERTLGSADIHPDAIGYVEGHGTGTQLGDSLEVVSMTQAFRKRTGRKQYCPLGSVKANLGHAESAAGIAGVAKILLQLQHRQIAPTIHSGQVNGNIDFESSPFYLQHRLSSWEAPDGQPRRAMINAFGAGGVNACLVIESHEGAAVEAGNGRDGGVLAMGSSRADHLVVLSARNETRLRESAARLREYLEAGNGVDRDIDLARLSYTLQAGREAMADRLAVVVSSVDELSAALSAYAAGTSFPGLAAGRVEAHRGKKSRRKDADAQARVLFDQGGLEALALMWLEGQAIDWDELHGADHPRRLPLPTYPFARDRHWVSDSPVPGSRADAKPRPAQPRPAQPRPAQLHPLVCANVSTLADVCFSSALSAGEYYGRDHRVNGEPFFPGAGFMEIACASAAIAGEASVTRIEDIVWIQPLRLTTPDLRLSTFFKSSGNYNEFAIVSFDDDNERVVHCEGRVSCAKPPLPGEDVRAAYPIEALRQRAVRTVPGSDCYRRLEGFGFHYGPSFQTIQELHVGSGFALSRLSLAEELKPEFEQYLLHPCLIDGALQTVLGLAAGWDGGEGGDAETPYLPFALGEVEILRPLQENCHVYVEPAASSSANPDIRQFDIRLLSESGQVLVRLNNFHVRALRSVPRRQPERIDAVVDELVMAD